MTEEKISFTRKSIPYLLLLPIIMGTYLLMRITGMAEDPTLIQVLMLPCLTVPVAIALWNGLQKKLTWSLTLKLLLVIGMVLRIGYTMYTGCETRAHDLGDINLTDAGHASYLLTIMETGHLPDNNLVQLYQQPLFYYLGAAVSKLVNGILGCEDAYYLVDASKLVSCYASCAVLLLTVPLCRELQVGEKGTVAGTTLVTFLPVFCLSGGRVNSEMLATLFMVLAVLYTLRFIHKKSWKNILVLAFVYGFGMMTKISCATVALFTAVVFLILLAKNDSDGKGRGLFVKYLVFGMISLPIGLWFSVRNYILFEQPLTYVAKISEESELYTGGWSVFSRFMPINWSNLFSSPYANPWNDYNLPLYQLKTALFGEFTYSINDFLPVIMLFTALILSVVTVWITLGQTQKRWKNPNVSAVAAVLALMLFSSALFYAEYPFGCSMDFRYYTLLPVLFAPFLGMSFEEDGKLAGILKIFLPLLGLEATAFLLMI